MRRDMEQSTEGGREGEEKGQQVRRPCGTVGSRVAGGGKVDRGRSFRSCCDAEVCG